MKLVRFALISAALAAIAVGCGSSAPAPTSPQVVPATEIAAAHWVPSQAVYVSAGTSLSGAQSGLRALIDGVGMFAGIDANLVGGELATILGVDAISTEAVAAIGIDTNASFSLFSEGLAPTSIVKISDPDAFARFVEKMRGRGMRSTSVVVNGTEVFSAPLGDGFAFSWALADGWLWVHLVPPYAMGEGTGWFEHSRAGQTMAGAVADGFAWASKAAGAGSKVTMWLDAQRLLGMLGDKVPAAKACVGALASVQGAGVGISVENGAITARLSLDVGPHAGAIKDATLPVPEGLPSLVDASPFAAQWNLDLVQVESALGPCFALADIRLDQLAATGVRAARVAVQKLDMNDQSGEGVVSLALTKKDYFASKLDDVPGRRFLERDRTFGPLKGHALSVPTIASVDYVLDDQQALVAMGDGVLARAVGKGSSVPGPIFGLDLRPAGFDEANWRALFQMLDVHGSKEVVEQLMKWRDAHLSVTLEGTSLVLTASGTRAR
ncbi:MAG TPA: hypothetical protein VGM39_16490 [Kofleriaceae bacterium]|jgi:hypothetical protein